MKIEFHGSVQRLEVQFGLAISSRSKRGTGIGVGSGFACGSRVRNEVILFWDKASAIGFLIPGKWEAHRSSSSLPMNAKQRAKCMDSWFLQEPWLMLLTAATLSHHTFGPPFLSPYHG